MASTTTSGIKVAVFSARSYDREFLEAANRANEAALQHEFVWIEQALSADTVHAASQCQAVCTFVNDVLDAGILQALAAGGTRLVALRCAGFNQVDLAAAAAAGITVTNVPAYSPNSVAEHAIALLLTLNRRTHVAHDRIHAGNFTLDGLTGFDLNGKTVSLLGTGKIGLITGRILKAFGCTVLAYDPYPSPEALEAGFRFCALAEALSQADVVSLHCPLLPTTKHIINADTLALMKPNALLVNTSRGGLVDTAAALAALESGRLGGLAIDVYENEANLFFHDHSATGIKDALFKALESRPNVVVTAHQAFLTREALTKIAAGVLGSLNSLATGAPMQNVLFVPK